MIRARSAQRGVGLIEILVAVVLLSLGFLAAARMQVESMRSSQSAYFTSQANLLAADMVDRMRLNTTGVLAGLYDAVDTADAIADPNCRTKACTAAELAAQDAFDWRSHFIESGSVRPLLPGVDGTPANGTVTSLGDGSYQVRIRWSEVIDNENTDQDLTLVFVAES